MKCIQTVRDVFQRFLLQESLRCVLLLYMVCLDYCVRRVVLFNWWINQQLIPQVNELAAAVQERCVTLTQALVIHTIFSPSTLSGICCFVPFDLPWATGATVRTLDKMCGYASSRT